MNPVDAESLVLYGFWTVAMVWNARPGLDEDELAEEVVERVLHSSELAPDESAMREALDIDRIVEGYASDSRFGRRARAQLPRASWGWDSDVDIIGRDRAQELISLGCEVLYEEGASLEDLGQLCEAVVNAARSPSDLVRSAQSTATGIATLLVAIGDEIAGPVRDLACGTGAVLVEAARRGRQELIGRDIDASVLPLTRARVEVWPSSVAFEAADALDGFDQPDLDGLVIFDPPLEESLPPDIPAQTAERAGIGSRDVRFTLDDVWMAAVAERLAAGAVGAVVLSADSLIQDSPNSYIHGLVERGAVAAVVILPPGSRPLSDGPTVAWVVCGTPDTKRGALVVDARHAPRDPFVALHRSDSEALGLAVRDWMAGREVAVPEWAVVARWGGEKRPGQVPQEDPDFAITSVAGEAAKGRLLRGLAVSHFKSIHDAEVPLRPLTLVFGPNSAGKSSLIQALLALAHSLEVGGIRAAFGEIDLGSFENAISAHNTAFTMGVSARFALDRAPGGSIADEASYGADFAASGNGADWESLRVGIGSRGLRMDNPRLRSGATTLSFKHVRSLLDLRYPFQEDHQRVLDDVRDAFGISGATRSPGFEPAWEELRERLRSEEPELIDLRRFQELDEGASADVKLRGLLVGSVGQASGDKVTDARRAAFELLGTVLREVSERAYDVLQRVDYFGPLRPMPQRLYPVSADITDWNSELARLARDPRALRAVNGWLARVELPYEMRLTEVQYGSHSAVDAIAVTLTDTRSGVAVTPRDVGFGVSQVLPLVVALATKSSRIVCIEQPELHLHPALQATLGDLLIESTHDLGRGMQVIAETHSEHLLLRIQRRIREGAIDPERVCVLYVDNYDNSGAVIRRLRLGSDGGFIDEWPNGFFEERLHELFGDA
ncbi:AAA family ATPase [Microbacterium invictum]|uniref:SAM-dependent methyltransferase n=1 Tax=Microbacterium invictum TaxID=515415 RepID=A0AA40SQ81_9MICO|nr:AAA family ATPase [Microbacterium invictum]MBB4140407.1 SAM-dependent methyltransferase [Microbacterium invictum]